MEAPSRASIPCAINLPLLRPPKRFLEWEAFTKGAQRMMKSPEIGKVFALDAAERARYGATPMGDACLHREKHHRRRGRCPLHPDQSGGWDHHAAIYGKDDKPHGEDPKLRGGLYQLCSLIGLASLVADLKSRKKQRRLHVPSRPDLHRLHRIIRPHPPAN